MTDHAARARELEEALDWSAAGKAWALAERTGAEEARAGQERARQALAMIGELCDLAEEELARGDLKSAREPLEAAGDLAGKEHPRVTELRKRWLRECRGRLRRLRGLKWTLGIIVFGVVLVTVILLAPQGLPPYALVILPPGAALAAVAIGYALIPGLRTRDLRRLRLRDPASWRMRQRSGKKVVLRPGPSRAIEEWRRNAALEREGNRWGGGG